MKNMPTWIQRGVLNLYASIFCCMSVALTYILRRNSNDILESIELLLGVLNLYWYISLNYKITFKVESKNAHIP